MPEYLYFTAVLFLCLPFFRGPLNMTISDLFFLLSFFSSLLFSYHKGETLVPSALPVSAVILFTIGGMLSSIYAAEPVSSVLFLCKVLYALTVPFWLTLVMVRNESRFMIVLSLWSLSATVSSIGAIAQFMFPGRLLFLNQFYLRMAGFTDHPNHLGLALSLILIPQLNAVAAAKNIWHVLWVSVIINTIALVLTVSLTSTISIVAGLVFWLALHKFGRIYSRTGLVWLAILFLSVLFVHHSGGLTVGDRILTYSNSDQGLHYDEDKVAVRERIHSIVKAVSRIKENMLIGTGFGRLNNNVGSRFPVHNFLLLTWLEAGVFGVLGMIMLLGYLFISGWKLYRSGAAFDATQDHSAALLSSLFIFLFSGVAHPVLFDRYAWFPLTLLLACRNTGHALPGARSRPVA